MEGGFGCDMLESWCYRGIVLTEPLAVEQHSAASPDRKRAHVEPSNRRNGMIDKGGDVDVEKAHPDRGTRDRIRSLRRVHGHSAPEGYCQVVPGVRSNHPVKGVNLIQSGKLYLQSCRRTSSHGAPNFQVASSIGVLVNFSERK